MGISIILFHSKVWGTERLNGLLKDVTNEEWLGDRHDTTSVLCPGPGACSSDAMLMLVIIGPVTWGPLTPLCHSSMQMAHVRGRWQVKCRFLDRKTIKVKHDPFFDSIFIWGPFFSLVPGKYNLFALWRWHILVWNYFCQLQNKVINHVKWKKITVATSKIIKYAIIRGKFLH